MTEVLGPRINNSEVIPTFKSNIFEGHEDSRFAVGIIGSGTATQYPKEKLAYHQLRARVYAEQTRMISLDKVQDDGGEYDHHDDDALHMCVIENAGKEQRMVGSLRLIFRSDDQPLPIESFFPDVFKDNPAPETSTEVSRYIGRHEDLRIQQSLRPPLLRRVVAFIAANKLGPTYAVIEPGLAPVLTNSGMNLTRLADPVFVPEYNEYNLPITIDMNLLAKQFIAQDRRGMIHTMRNPEEFTYFGMMPMIDIGRRAVRGVAELN